MKWYDKLFTRIRNFFRTLRQRRDRPAPTPPAPPPLATSLWSLSLEWSYPRDTYKLVGLLGAGKNLFVTLSNVYRSPRRSRIFIAGSQVYPTDPRHAGPQETIGQPFAHGSRVYFPVEHGNHILVGTQGTTSVFPGAATPGRWSVCGCVWQGRPVLAYNNSYGSGRTFQDSPIIVDARTNEILATLPINAMPRKMFEYQGELWVSHNFGECGVLAYTPSGASRHWFSNIVMIEPFAGAVYGAESAAWGRAANPGTANGRVWRYAPITGQWRPIFDTHCSSVQCMFAHNGNLWIAGIDPDRLYLMTPNEDFTLVADFPGETPADQARSFGAAVTHWNGHIYYGRSDNNQAHVYKVMKAQ